MLLQRESCPEPKAKLPELCLHRICLEPVGLTGQHGIFHDPGPVLLRVAHGVQVNEMLIVAGSIFQVLPLKI